MAPEGLRYVGSWVEVNFDRCFQIMECDDARLLQEWMADWGDLVEFEVVPLRKRDVEDLGFFDAFFANKNERPFHVLQ